MSESHRKLSRYVEAASDLAESLREDIKGGYEVSPETMKHLGRFIQAAYDAQAMLDLAEAISGKNSLN